MAFFRNAAINLLNLHFGIHAAALTGGGAFFMIYLLKSGVSIPGVLLAIAAILAGRFAIRPVVIGFAVRFGLRRMVMAGTLLSAVQYPLLAEVHGIGPALFLLVAISAAGDTVYWTTYHAYFAALGDDELWGHQTGVREAITAIVGVVSPLIGGWLLVSFGPRVAFGTTAAVAAAAALPLWWAPEVAVARQVSGALKAAVPGILLFAADGWTAAGYYLVWPIALFVSLGESILAYGGALAFAAFAGAIGGLTLGRHIDDGHGKRAVWYAYGAMAVMVVTRAAGSGHAALAVLANTLGAFGACLYVPTMMTAVYTMAKRSPCPLRFHVATEAGWDIGGASGLLAAALIVELGLPLSVAILLALAGVAASAIMLRRYYVSGPAPATMPLTEAGREPA